MDRRIENDARSHWNESSAICYPWYKSSKEWEREREKENALYRHDVRREELRDQTRRQWLDENRGEIEFIKSALEHVGVGRDNDEMGAGKHVAVLASIIRPWKSVLLDFIKEKIADLPLCRWPNYRLDFVQKLFGDGASVRSALYQAL